MPAQPEGEVLATDSPALFEQALERATALLRAGQVVAVPTETVYGLAANAFDSQAVRRIFQIKGRPAHNPIIVHVAGLELAHACASEWSAAAEKLAHAFWPGPLTLVLPRSNKVPDVVSAGGATVGIRWPSHPFMQALIRACGFPLAAPSANLSSRLSPTSAAHVQAQLGTRVPLIVDGGQAQVGIESTVLDLSVTPPRVLRPGIIHNSALTAVIGRLDTGKSEAAPSAVLKSPGLLRKHYAPRARLSVCSWSTETELLAQLDEWRIERSRVCVVAHTHIPSGSLLGRVSVIPHDPEAFARALYAELYACDQAAPELIVVEQVPEGDEWDAVRDRLNRAAQV